MFWIWDWNSKQNFAFLNKETAIIFLSLRIDYLYFLHIPHNSLKNAKGVFVSSFIFSDIKRSFIP